MIDGRPGTNEHREHWNLWGYDSQLPYLHTRRMVFCMKTTLNIDDTVMRRLREEAARRQTTMSSLVEAGLRRVLADAGKEDRETHPLPSLPSWKSGGQRVDISNREEMYGVLEGG